jgi:glycosyl transferase family 2
MIKFLSPRAWRGNVERWSRGRFKTLDDFLSEAEDASLELEPIVATPPLRNGDIALVTMVRNEAQRLPAFLKHYRKLGVNRFFVIDNASTDETHDILAGAPGVDLWLARGEYKKGRLLWLSALIHAFAREAWVVVADADEFLVYDGMETHDLHALAQRLEGSGEGWLRAVLIDLYGKGPIRTTGWPSGDPLGAQWFFDFSSYTTKKGGLWGGPRSRVFSTEASPFRNNLGKYPLARFDAASGLTNIHYPYPYHKHDDAPRAALLHLKFTSDFVALVERAVVEKQFWQEAKEYRIYKEALDREPSLSMFYEGSMLYNGPASLVEAGLIQTIAWDRQTKTAKPEAAPIRHRIHAGLRSLFGPHFSAVRRRHQRVLERHQAPDGQVQ